MKVKVIGADKTAPKKTYPYIGRNSFNVVVLFSAKNEGTTLYYPQGLPGSYYTSWDENNFEYFTGKIELSNED